MNNQQFRHLILENPASSNQQHADIDKSTPVRTPGAVLGVRKHNSVPMTPRQVGRSTVQADFARQLAQRNAKANPRNKFRSAAPKGTKLAPGYTDRSKLRDDQEENEQAKRIKNLEASMKLGQIDRATFEKLVQEITGGDISSTHLVKGLDRKLLERVRRGEDVIREHAEFRDETEVDLDLEDHFDELAEQEVGPITREKVEKKGERALPPPIAGVKRSRADVLADLRRQQDEAAAAVWEEHEKKYPTLGAGFRKIDNNAETKRIEKDSRGREILIITDAQGKEKRKVRKQRLEDAPLEMRRDLDDETKPINMHNLPAPKEEDTEDDDIFEGVGSNYNPLAEFDNEDSSSDESAAEGAKPAVVPLPLNARSGNGSAERIHPSSELDTSTNDQNSDPASATTKHRALPSKRDYFVSTSRALHQQDVSRVEASSAADATVRAALQKVRTLDADSTLLNDPDSQEARLQKRARELAGNDRDMDDMDLGFGGSRFDDADEMEREGEKIKLSEWKGIGVEDKDDPEDTQKGGKKRKRGPKKKKGDKNSVSDVLMVMERQKAQKKLG